MIDGQAGIETTMSSLLTALAGANVIYGMGMLDLGITFDYAKLVMDNEFAAMIKHVVKGVSTDDASLALDVIDEIGPAGEYLSHTHTLKRCRTEHSQVKLINREMYDIWKANGGKDITERAYDAAKDLYLNYKPAPLEEGILKQLRRIVNEAEDHYGVTISEE